MRSPFTARSFFALLAAVLTACAGTRPVDAPATGEPRAFIWEVTRAGQGDRRLFVAGSVHVGAEDLKLPPSMQDAFDKADVLVVEVDSAAGDPQALQTMVISKGTYPPGQKITEHLTPKTKAMLESTLPRIGLPLQGVERLRPWLLATTVTILEMQKAGFSGNNGIDAQLMSQARKQNKKIVQLETAQLQLEMLAGLPADVQDLMLRDTLEQSELTAISLAKTITAWQGGNPQAMEDVIKPQSMNPAYEPLYQRMFTDRNRTMTEKIAALADSPETHFVVVGAGHLVGPDGIVALLQRKGFTVKQLSRDP